MEPFAIRHVICGRTDLPTEDEAKQVILAVPPYATASSVVIDSLHLNDDGYAEINATVTMP